jgi:hypothetical protein
LGVQHFPLWLTYETDPARTWCVRSKGAFTYTRDGRLLYWGGDSIGACQAAEGLPPGNLHWADPVSRENRVRAIIGKLSERGLYALSYDDNENRCDVVRLESGIEQPRTAFMFSGVAFVVSDAEVCAVDSDTGQRVGVARTNGMLHHRGRFFRRRNGIHWDWYAVAFNGREVVWELLFKWQYVFQDGKKRPELIAVFDAVHQESPIGITSTGSLISSDSGAAKRVNLGAQPADLAVCGVSRDGSKAILEFSTPLTRKRVQLDVRTATADTAHYYNQALPAVALEMPEIRKVARTVSMRRRFEGIGVSTGGVLLLIGRRETIWLLRFDEREKSFRLATKPALTNIAVSQRFANIETGEENRYSLSAATFADGSRAVLDGRGLLHLKSSDPALPECTIVLVEGATSGWVADGRYWGARYFIANQPAVSAETIYAEVIRPFTERLR